MATKVTKKVATKKRVAPSTKRIQQLEAELKESRDLQEKTAQQLKYFEDKLNSEYAERMTNAAGRKTTTFQDVAQAFADNNQSYSNLLDRLEAFVGRVTGEQMLLKLANLDTDVKSFQEAIFNNEEVFDTNNSRLALVVSTLEEIG